MAHKQILQILFCFNIFIAYNSLSQNVPNGELSATDRLKTVYLRYNETYELTGRNDNPVIKKINNSFKINPVSAYCGSSLYYLCMEAGFELNIPKSQSPIARNWSKHGEVVWSSYNGWKVGKEHKPKPNEIFVLLFNYNGQNHITVILDIHGDLNYITGEGNTSDSKVRKKEYLYYNNIKAKNKNIYIVNKKRQGIFAGKERYHSSAMSMIIKYQVK